MQDGVEIHPRASPSLNGPGRTMPMTKENQQKSLCKWTKSEVTSRLAELAEMVDRPDYLCGKCARTSSIKKTLCKPTRIDEITR